MTLDEFKNRVDGTINDFQTGIYDATEFRTSIMELLILVASPHLDRKPKEIKHPADGLHNTSTQAFTVEGNVIIRPDTIAARIWSLTPDMIRFIESIVDDLSDDPDDGPMSDMQLQAVDLHRQLKPGKYDVEPDHTAEQIMQNTQAVIDSGFLQAADSGFEIGNPVCVKAEHIEKIATYTNRPALDRTYFVSNIYLSGKLALAHDQDLKQSAYIHIKPEHVTRLPF